MVVKDFIEHKTEGCASVGAWFCESCQCSHVKAVFLTFDRNEFADFSDSVFDCYSTNLKLTDF